MTLLEKIQFVLENTSAVGAAKLINNTDQMDEVQKIGQSLWEKEAYTSPKGEAALKAAMIIAINNKVI